MNYLKLFRNYLTWKKLYRNLHQIKDLDELDIIKY